MSEGSAEDRPGTGRRAWTTGAALLAAWSFAAAEANAQRLWSVGEATRAPDGPAAAMEGATVGPGPGGVAGARRAGWTAEVRVRFDYLRLGFGRVELPLPDGSAIEAENAVFEDRGGGNLMWTGEVPGAGYESVLFTVQDGHLVGWFGEPGGPKYVVRARPDGSGSLREELEPSGDWCGVGRRPEEMPGGSVPPAAESGRPDGGAGRAPGAAGSASERPGAVASEADGDRLDILFLYTTGTARQWEEEVGRAAAGVQQFEDYLNMVLRNGALPATANLIPKLWNPEVNNHPLARGGHFRDDTSPAWQLEFTQSASVAALRDRYRADLVHFVPELIAWGAGGFATLRQDLRVAVLTGWSTPYPGIFAHEIGHNLGGRHEPATFGERFGDAQAGAVRPHAFGHTDLTSCSEREGWDGRSVCPMTVMSYGSEAWETPGLAAAKEPFYSSVRHKPNGWTIGVAGMSEVERVLQETIPVAVRSGEESVWLSEQFPTIGARWTGRDTVRVTWSRYSGGTRQIAAYFAAAGGANNYYFWWAGSTPPPSLEGWGSPNVTPIFEADGATTGVDVGGLRPAGGYRIAVGPYHSGSFSDPFVLAPPRPAPGSPAPPSGVNAGWAGSDRVRLTWADNSNDESGFEVWYRKWSGYPRGEDTLWRRHGAPLPAGTRSVSVGGLKIEEDVVGDGLGTVNRGRYSFVVLAYNDRGFSTSEDLHIELRPGAVLLLPPADPLAFEPGTSVPDQRWEEGAFIAPLSLPAASGGQGELTYSLSPPPPEGVSFDRSLRTLSGRPTTVSGPVEYTYAATDATGASASLSFTIEVVEAGGSCRSSSSATCLQGSRYEVAVDWWTADGQSGDARVADVGTADSGLFWFFSATNWELLVKVLDGCAVNGHHWVFGAATTDVGYRVRVTDTESGTVREYRNEAGRAAPAIADVTAFSEACAATGATAAGRTSEPRDPPDPRQPLGLRQPHGSLASPRTAAPILALQDGRFEVGVQWTTEGGETGPGSAAPERTVDSGLFWFFEPSNWEMLVKVLDGCAQNGHYWVLAGSATTLGFEIAVTDTEAGAVRRYLKADRREPAAAFVDVSAFPCSP